MKMISPTLFLNKNGRHVNPSFYLSVILILPICDFFVAGHINSLWLFPFVMFLLPGLLLRKLIVRTRISAGESLSYTIGLAILAGELVGLFNSGIKATFGFGGLGTISLLVSYTLLNCTLLGLSKKAKLFSGHLKITSRLSIQNWLLCVVIMLLPVLSALGAISLNNGGSAFLTIIMLIVSVLLFGYLLLKKESLPNGISLLFLFSSSLSFLWMYSLRSHYLIGYDIQQELGVAQLTQQQHMWAIGLSRDPYNAMLSITVLPVLLANVLHCSLLTVFKVLIPFIFSLIPIIIYGISIRTYKLKPIALAASFFFIAQYQFMEEMPALARQEFGFLFFGLFLSVLFHDLIKSNEKKNLFYLFALGLIVSHYSTAYIAIGLFVFAYVAKSLVGKKVLKLNIIKELGQPGLQGLLVISMILFAFLWNFQFTQSSHDIKKFIAGSFKTLRSESTSNEQEGIVTGSAESNPGLVKKYFTQAEKTYTTKNITPLTKNQSDNDTNLLTGSSETISARNNIAYQLSNALKYALFLIERAGIVIGCILIFYRSRKQQRLMLFEYGLLSLATICLIAVIEVVPGWSAEYNIERLVQQGLILLAPLLMFGGFSMLKKVNIRVATLFMFIVPAFTLLFSSGLMAQTFGGTAELNLNNYGENYDRFYIHKSEVLAASWLSRQYHSPAYVYADRYAARRLVNYTSLPMFDKNDILPQTVDRSSYVYASHTNTVSGIEKSAYGSGVVTFEFPNTFLQANKDVIYTTGDTNIYK